MMKGKSGGLDGKSNIHHGRMPCIFIPFDQVTDKLGEERIWGEADRFKIIRRA